MYIRRLGSEFLRPWVQRACNDQQRVRDNGRYYQDGKSHAIVPAMRKHSGNHERPEQRAELVQRFVDAESPSVADLFGGGKGSIISDPLRGVCVAATTAASRDERYHPPADR
jgi:hypothetical protein